MSIGSSFKVDSVGNRSGSDNIDTNDEDACQKNTGFQEFEKQNQIQ